MHLRARLDAVFTMTSRGEDHAALAALEAMRADVDASADPGIRSTFLQTLAGVLDKHGRREEALAAAREALAIDRAHWPEARGTFLSLHSLVVVLEGLGRRDEAGGHLDELLALGEQLGGGELAAAATLAAQRAVRGKRLAEAAGLLERARAAADAALREEGAEARRCDVVTAHANATLGLARLHARMGRLDEAEALAGETTRRLGRELASAPVLERKLAVTWDLLAGLARTRRAAPEARLLLRYVLALLPAGDPARDAVASMLASPPDGAPSDPEPLDVFRVLRRTGGAIMIAHPREGRYVLGNALAARVNPGDRVDVERDAEGEPVGVRPIA